MAAPLLSINIVTFNTSTITINCIKSILKSVDSAWMTDKPEDDIEIVVIDNNSHDDTKERLDELSVMSKISIRTIKNSVNTGFGKAHNRASRESKGEVLLLMNSDTIVLGHGINDLVAEYIQHNSIVHPVFCNRANARSKNFKKHFLAPKLLNKDLTDQPSCGPYYSIPVILMSLFMKGDHIGLTRQSPNHIKQVDWTSGACFICKRDYFEELGGFDEKIFMYMEEIDLMYRARKMGMSIWYTPKAQVVHLGSASSDNKYPIYQVYRGFLYLYNKHHSSVSLAMVKSILRLKAGLAIVLGRLIHDDILVEVYTNSLKIVNEDIQKNNQSV
jgi:GT2 family glycosyltransferase